MRVAPIFALDVKDAPTLSPRTSDLGPQAADHGRRLGRWRAGIVPPGHPKPRWRVGLGRQAVTHGMSAGSHPPVVAVDAPTFGLYDRLME